MVRDSNDIANELENLRNLRHYSRNHFSNKIKYKLQHFSRIRFLFKNLANAIRFELSKLCQFDQRIKSSIPYILKLYNCINKTMYIYLYFFSDIFAFSLQIFSPVLPTNLIHTEKNNQQYCYKTRPQQRASCHARGFIKTV